MIRVLPLIWECVHNIIKICSTHLCYFSILCHHSNQANNGFLKIIICFIQYNIINYFGFFKKRYWQCLYSLTPEQCEKVTSQLKTEQQAGNLRNGVFFSLLYLLKVLMSQWTLLICVQFGILLYMILFGQGLCVYIVRGTH